MLAYLAAKQAHVEAGLAPASAEEQEAEDAAYAAAEAEAAAAAAEPEADNASRPIGTPQRKERVKQLVDGAMSNVMARKSNGGPGLPVEGEEAAA